MACDPGHHVMPVCLSALIVGVKSKIQIWHANMHVEAARKLMISSYVAPSSRKEVAYRSRSGPSSCCCIHHWVAYVAGTGVVTLLLLVVGLPWATLGAPAVGAGEGLAGYYDHARAMGSMEKVSSETGDSKRGARRRHRRPTSPGGYFTEGALPSSGTNLEFPQGAGELTPELERNFGLDPNYLMSDDVDESVGSSNGVEKANGRDDVHASSFVRNSDKQQYSLPLQNMDNVQYFGEVLIGEPPQLLKV